MHTHALQVIDQDLILRAGRLALCIKVPTAKPDSLSQNEGRRQVIPTSCPLTSTGMLWQMCTHIHTQSHTQIIYNFLKKIFSR